MKVLVTGAGGFIGSHLTEELVRKGYDVRAMVHYNALGKNGWLDHIDEKVKAEIEIVAGDIRDITFVRRMAKDCDGIFHLAALIGIPYSYVNPESYIDTNVKGTMNVLESARDFDMSKVIHTSTSEVYGSAQYVPIDEKHPLQGQSPYSASKIGADQMARAYQNSFETPVVTVRPFNTFGPRQSARAVIPTIITQMVNSPKIKIGSVTPTRDFSHVQDTVSGFITAFECDNKDMLGQVVNLGSGFEVSISETIELVGEILGVTPDVTTESERERPEHSEVNRLFADNSKFIELSGWKPEYAGKDGFKRALETVVEWYKRPENLQHFDHSKYTV